MDKNKAVRKLIRKLVITEVRNMTKKRQLNEAVGGFVGLSPINRMGRRQNQDNFSFNGFGSIGSKQSSSENKMGLIEQELSGAEIRSAYRDEQNESVFTIDLSNGRSIRFESIGGSLNIEELED